MQKLVVYIADNQMISRIGSSTILEKHFSNNVELAYAATKDELKKKLSENQPHLLIIDFDLFDFKDVSELFEIKNNFKSMGILVFTEEYQDIGA